MSNILSRIHSPQDLRGLTKTELRQLSAEIRSLIIRTVAANGGHLASNLGAVELTIALHYVFPSLDDRIVWDVGHQAYTHKILTGRRGEISTIRTKGGLSGFPNRTESPYDPFTVGHASTSISSALGLAEAKRLAGEPGNVVAVIGDGALTGGMAYEGLNNAGHFPGNFMVILNDNTMSISRNVGSMARYLASIRTKPGYLRAKNEVEQFLDKVPVVGKPIHRGISRSKTAVKHMLYNSNLFEDMGFNYYGPFDGHNIDKLVEVLENTKNIPHPLLIHVVTDKGKGYPFAEQNPGAFHGVSGFNVKTGQTSSSEDSFSSIFGNCLCELAEKDERICAITAAMELGTGLSRFASRFPTRFFDVGIAEEHAVAFAGGLAVGGSLPVCAIYSTFLQRSYDQILHDAVLQNAHVVLAVDRAGIVGEDGETHQGIFDAAFLNTIPGVTVFSPAYYEDLREDLRKALYECSGVVVVRYPRGGQLFKPHDLVPGKRLYAWGHKAEEAEVLLVTYGRLFSFTCRACELLKERGIAAAALRLDPVSPIGDDIVKEVDFTDKICFFEEGREQGGIGEHFAALLRRNGWKGEFHLKGISGFVKHAPMLETLGSLGLDERGMAEFVVTECETWRRKKG